MTDMQRELLAAFLRSRREALSPEQAGLTPGRRRRTPGLRREEVAQLSGVSLTWYTWLEQGRDIRVSRQVLEALAHTLQLTRAERRHLFTLAETALPAERPEPVAVNPTLRKLVETLDPFPAHVINDNWDLLAANRAYASLVGGLEQLPQEERNSIWLLFTRPQMQSLLVDWQREVRDILGQFRISVGRNPDDPRTAALIDTLTRSSSQFRALWSEHPVQAFRPTLKRFSHPTAGRLDLNYTKLDVADTPGQHLVVFMPAAEEDERALARLVAESGQAALL
ncbi:DNA-binding protein [Streptomyces hygroscopicus subsp. hygroscopicus]|uniref:helix-turn-helix transcriptional regulator n=1 Tax=Streptomyces sp. KHY 26 TaxID=3097359 RepID=UPI0024A2375D|nr:helix-turn-helix transcriptional regulator [Streptomyces hygroscopicus]GLX52608.1 DNA-binding protein [Streptomyces hygroscopicus subsp. hygroscopicus]